MEPYGPYNHYVEVQIRFCDTDMLNHVNNANYLSYMELARMSYLENVLGMSVDYSRYSVILAKATIDFKLPILLGDDIRVYLRTSRLGTKSFDVEYAFLRMNSNEPTVVAEGVTVMVAFDYEEQKTIPVLPEWRDKMAAFDGIETQ